MVQVISFVFSAIVVLENYSVKHACEGDGDGREEILHVEFWKIIKGWLLYIDLRAGQTCHSNDSGSAYSIGVGELAWQYRTGLKSHGTVTNWCTERGWPVNCMTVIFARWRSKHGIPNECVVNYNITRWKQKVSYFGDQTSLETRVVEKASNQQRAGPRASGWATMKNGEETLMAIRVGVNMLQFCSVSNSLSHTTLSNEVTGIFF